MPSYDLEYMQPGPCKDKHIEWTNTPCKKIEELYIKEFDNVTILPRIPSGQMVDSWMGYGGVLDMNGQWIPESGVYRCNGTRVFGGEYDITDQKINNKDLSNETVIYMGPYFPHWGHFLLDHIVRLWYAMEHTEERIAYISWDEGNQGIQGNFANLIRLLGIDTNRLVNIQEPTLFKHVIIPQPAFERGTYYSDQYSLMLNKVITSVGDLGLNTYDKICFSRYKFAKKHNKEYGHENLDRFWESNGYHIFYPEELSTEEQIYYVNRCKEFVVIPGGASMNALFLPDNAKIIYLQKEDEIVEINDLYQINEMRHTSEVAYISVYYKHKLFAKLIPDCRDKFWVGVTEELIHYAEDNAFKVSEDIKLIHFEKQYERAQIKYAIFEVRLKKIKNKVIIFLQKLPCYGGLRSFYRKHIKKLKAC